MEQQAGHSVSKQLLSRLTHHVRNPFNGIIGFADLLINHFDKLSDDDVRKHMMVVLLLSKKALLRSENLSWWLKYYTKNLTPVFQDTDVNEIIKDELSYFNAEISKQQLEISFSNEADTLFNTDKVMLQTIIRNALFNVIEFALPESEVEITLTTINNKLNLKIVNTFKDDPREETLNFIAQFNTPSVQTEEMPDNPGLWCIKALSEPLSIKPDLEFNDKTATFTLTSI